MLNKAFYIILFLSLSCCVQAQKIMRNTSLLNYQRGDRTVLHFGFSLGINYMDYKAVLSGANGWRAESGKLDVGFLVGIVSELRLGDDWGLRFLPGIDRLTDNIYPADPFCTDSCNPGSDLPQCFLHTCLFWLYSDLNFCIHIPDK